MTKLITFSRRADIKREAAAWIVRLDSAEPSEEDLNDLVDWLRKSQSHRADFVKLARVWGNIQVLSKLADIIPLQKPNRLIDRWLTPVFDSVLHRKSYWVMTSLGAVLIVGLLAWAHRLPHHEVLPRLEPLIYQTSVGAQKTIELPDGTIAKINTDSSLELAYNAEYREVRLTRGEVHFEVKHNPDRPFLVSVGGGQVKAVGTAFNVYYNAGAVNVTVTEGKVEVTLSERASLAPAEGAIAKIKSFMDDQSPTRIFVDAGYSVVFDTEIRSVEVMPQEAIDHKLAWQRSMLIFKGDFLEDAINEINRYSTTQIVITDPSLRKIRVGGYFKSGETEAMLKAFESMFGLQITRVNDDLIHISKKEG